jgi:hypothetical protein
MATPVKNLPLTVPLLRVSARTPENLLSQSSTGAGARKSNRRFWPEGRASGNEQVRATMTQRNRIALDP